MSLNNLILQLNESKRFILSKYSDFPDIVIVLGSGLGELVNEMDIDLILKYSEIPHFKSSTVCGHVGRLVVGKLNGVKIACLQGRLHFYEGYSMSEVVFPVRTLSWIGSKIFVITNASGGLNSNMSPLDFMLIKDHINLMGTNPLIGENFNELGPRFPDLTNLYCKNLRKIFFDTGLNLKLPIKEGVYLGIHGPTYETPAEIEMYKLLGADAVGMSTIPEAIALHHMGKKVVGLSCITNLAAGVSNHKVNHDDVLSNAKKMFAQFSILMKEVVVKLEAEID